MNYKYILPKKDFFEQSSNFKCLSDKCYLNTILNHYIGKDARDFLRKRDEWKILVPMKHQF